MDLQHAMSSRERRYLDERILQLDSCLEDMAYRDAIFIIRELDYVLGEHASREIDFVLNKYHKTREELGVEALPEVVVVQEPQTCHQKGL